MEEYSTPSGKQRGYHLLKAFPTQQLAWWGKKRASGWCKGVDGSWLRQPVHPSPKQGCSEPHAGQGTEAGAGSQPCHSSWQIPTLPPGLCPRQGTKLQWSWRGTMPNLPGSSSSAAGSSSHICSLYPEGRVPATGASSGSAPLAVLVRSGQALPVAPRATTMRRKASGSGSSACRTHWQSAGGSALFPQSQVASEPGAVDSSHLSTPESGSVSVWHNRAMLELPCQSNREHPHQHHSCHAGRMRLPTSPMCLSYAQLTWPLMTAICL